MHKPEYYIDIPWFCRSCWHRGVMTAPRSFWKGKSVARIKVDAQNTHMAMLRTQGFTCKNEDVKIVIKGAVK